MSRTRASARASLCESCASIFEPGTLYPSQSEYEPVKKNSKRVLQDPAQYAYFHHSTGKAQSNALAKGCVLCKAVVSGARHQDHIDLPFHNTLRVRRLAPGHSPWDDHDIELAISHYGEDTNYTALRVIIRSSPADRLHTSITRLADTDRILCELAVESQGCAYTGDTPVMVYAKQLYDRCRHSHTACGKLSEKDWHPTRLLDVSSETEIFLIDGADASESEYATLSHCWGTGKFWVTTIDNIEDFRSGIATADFPNTFRDTFRVVRCLGIRYLWIDSYCIIQGADEEARRDWEREASLMQKVYTNSAVNIGAAHANGPHEGLFSHRQPFHVGSVKWAPHNSAEDETEWYLYPQTGPTQPPSSHEQSLLHLKGTSPLLKRAWVVQECVLSPRMISFSRAGIYWHCSASACCELFPMGEGLRFPSYLTTSDFAFWMTKHIRSFDFDFDDESPRRTAANMQANFWFRWFYTLGMYIQSDLTYPDKDMFKAIEGVGRHVARLTGDIYHRGMLAKVIPYGLLWEVKQHHVDFTEAARYKREENKVSPRSGGHVPSWHWAYNGRIKKLGYRPVGYSRIEMSWYAVHHNSMQSRSLAHVFMSTEGRGLPSDATYDTWPLLYVIGRLEPVSHLIRSWMHTCMRRPHIRFLFWYAEHGDARFIALYINLDPVQESADEYALLPLLERVRAAEPVRRWTGLVVRKSTVATVWTRAGIFRAKKAVAGTHPIARLVVLQ